MSRNKNQGFTIIELLVVIIVIGILSAIIIIVYQGLQARAYDASVQHDLTNIAKKVKMYEIENNVYPIGGAQLATLDIKVNKSAYGSHFLDNYNLVYCRMPVTGPTKFGLVAYSRTGKGFKYDGSSGQLTEYTGPKTGSAAMCESVGIEIEGNPPDRDWFYDQGGWQSYVAG